MLYLAAIRYQTGLDHDSRRFLDAVAGASASERDSLKACAARLARGTHGLLREALLSFDFDRLELDFDRLDRLPDDDLPPGISGLLDLMEDDDALDEFIEFSDRVRNGLLPAGEFLDRLRAGLTELSQRDGRKRGRHDDDEMCELGLLDRLFDSCDYRGLPAPVLETVAEACWLDPELTSRFEEAARKVKAAGIGGQLSREARIFLFPNSAWP